MKPESEQIPDYPPYDSRDDEYWNVNRHFCAVANWTYGPIKDWEEERIRAAVDNLRRVIADMLQIRVLDRHIGLQKYADYARTTRELTNQLHALEKERDDQPILLGLATVGVIAFVAGLAIGGLFLRIGS